MSICLLNDSFPPMIDGVANAVVNYASELERLGEHSVVVTPAVPGAEDRGYPYPVLRYPSIDTRKLVGYVAGYPFSPEIMRRLKEEKVELLHSHCPIASTILARQLRSVLDAPLVLTYHTKFDIDIANALKSRLLQKGAIRAMVQNISACDEVWVVSRGAGENLRGLGYEGEYTVMPNGVDVPCARVSQGEIDGAAGEYDLPQGVPVFLFVGRLMWYKGLRITLDALARLKADKIPFRMVVIGDGADRREMEEYAGALGLSEQCFFLGAIRDRERIRAWYCRADLFLFPSTFDTNGLVVREAAACSLASVLVRGSCAAEDVTDNRNGFLIEENGESMAACLKSLCKNPDLMHRVGQCAARELYMSWEEAVHLANDRYRVIIDRYRSGGYPKPEKMMDGFLDSQGELMDALARIRETLLRMEERSSRFGDR